MKFRRLLAYMVVVASIATGMRAEDVQQVQQLWQRWSVKNNLIYDATLTPNLGIEYAIGPKTSAQLFFGINPWTFSDNKKLRHWSLMPEWRRWLSEQPFKGWFWGVHLVGGEYNAGGVTLPFGLFKPLQHNRYEGWYGGGGLTLGHAWRLSDHWRLEAAIGMGYVHTRYHQYAAEVCGEDRGTGHYNYVGPTKLALNIAYVFGNKPELPPPPPATDTVRMIYCPQYQLAYITPQAEEEKTRQLSGRAFIDFVVDKTDIRPNYRGNAAELAKVMKTIDVVRLDTFATITHVNIHGYASPESPFKHNAYLAQARAEAFANYVQSLISLPKSIFTIDSTPEDWEGLYARLDSLMSSSSGSLKSLTAPALQAIIRDTAIEPDAKERQLKKRYPREWRLMLDSIFPALRHSDYEVSYTIRPFTVEEAARVIREKPQHLSLNEMFLVANTYEPGSQDYNDVFEIAVRMYPNDETANLNAAVISLGKNDLVAARRYLNKAGSSPEAQNARAVLAIRENRLGEAEQLLREIDLPQARHNLDELLQYLQSIE